MAGVYHVYTHKHGIRYAVKFRCAKCNTENALGDAFMVSTSYSDRSTWTKAGLEKRRLKSLDQLEEKVDKETARLQELFDQKAYGKIKTTVRCKNCKHCPAWSYADTPFLRVLRAIRDLSLAIGSIVLVLVIASCISRHKFEASSLKPALLIVPGLLLLLYDGITELLRRKKIKSMDPAYLPQFWLMK